MLTHLRRIFDASTILEVMEFIRVRIENKKILALKTFFAVWILKSYFLKEMQNVTVPSSAQIFSSKTFPVFL